MKGDINETRKIERKERKDTCIKKRERERKKVRRERER